MILAYTHTLMGRPVRDMVRCDDPWGLGHVWYRAQYESGTAVIAPLTYFVPMREPLITVLA